MVISVPAVHSDLNFFLMGYWVFPFHILVITIWQIMVDPSFITSGSATQIIVTFLMRIAQKVVTCNQTVIFMLFCEFWNAFCMDLWR
jgi:hypothetical protein